MMRNVLVGLTLGLAPPAFGATPVSYSCEMDDIYRTTKTWYRDGEVLQQFPAGSEKIPALTEMVIVTDTAEEMVATLADLDPGVTYEWGINLTNGHHWDTTMEDGAIVARTFGKCVVNY